MSKLSFRARALDPSKQMPIYLAEELPDLPEYSAINRAVPQMPSGMEKEEESEHHLQRAICTGLIIPTPEVFTTDQDFYDKSYPPNYKMPRQMIHMQPLGLEQDIPDYDMDSSDEIWVSQQSRRLDLTPLKFEQMMDRLEKSSGQTVVTLNEAKALLKQDDEVSIAVYDYWLNKRLKMQHPLILSVKTENRPGTSSNNPYLAFRRRTEKMQTRKNRKNDETSYEKMLKLRRDLQRATTVLEMVKRREKTKREQLHLSIEIFEKRVQLRDFSGAVMSELSSSFKNSRPAFAPLYTNQYSHHSSSSATTPTGVTPSGAGVGCVLAPGILTAGSTNTTTSSGHLYSSTSQYLNSSSLAIDAINASGSGSRKEKRQYKKRKHKLPRDKQLHQQQQQQYLAGVGPPNAAVAAAAAAAAAAASTIGAHHPHLHHLHPHSSSPAAIESNLDTEEEDYANSNPQKNGSEGEEEVPYAFRRRQQCDYLRPLTADGNWPWEPQEDNDFVDTKYRFTLTSIRHPRPRCIGFARRRLGRGGRVILDRASTNLDDFWSQLDYTIFENKPKSETKIIKKELQLPTSLPHLSKSAVKSPASPPTVVDLPSIVGLTPISATAAPTTTMTMPTIKIEADEYKESVDVSAISKPVVTFATAEDEGVEGGFDVDGKIGDDDDYDDHADIDDDDEDANISRDSCYISAVTLERLQRRRRRRRRRLKQMKNKTAQNECPTTKRRKFNHANVVQASFGDVNSEAATAAMTPLSRLLLHRLAKTIESNSINNISNYLLSEKVKREKLNGDEVSKETTKTEVVVAAAVESIEAKVQPTRQHQPNNRMTPNFLNNNNSSSNINIINNNNNVNVSDKFNVIKNETELVAIKQETIDAADDSNEPLISMQKSVNTSSAVAEILDDEDNVNLARLSSLINANRQTVKKEPCDTMSTTPKMENIDLKSARAFVDSDDNFCTTPLNQMEDVIRLQNIRNKTNAGPTACNWLESRNVNVLIDDMEPATTQYLGGLSPTSSQRLDVCNELLSEIRRDWLHFRPKTPSDELSDGISDSWNKLPSQLIDNPVVDWSEQTPISVELQRLRRLTEMKAASISPPQPPKQKITSLTNLWDTNNDDALFVTTSFAYVDLEPDTQLLQNVYAPDVTRGSSKSPEATGGNSNSGIDFNLSGDSLNDINLLGDGDENDENMLDNILQECQIDDLKTLNQTTNFWNGILDGAVDGEAVDDVGGDVEAVAGLLDCIDDKKVSKDGGKRSSTSKVKMGKRITNSYFGCSNFSNTTGGMNGLRDEAFFKKEKPKSELEITGASSNVVKIEPEQIVTPLSIQPTTSAAAAKAQHGLTTTLLHPNANLPTQIIQQSVANLPQYVSSKPQHQLLQPLTQHHHQQHAMPQTQLLHQQHQQQQQHEISNVAASVGDIITVATQQPHQQIVQIQQQQQTQPLRNVAVQQLHQLQQQQLVQQHQQQQQRHQQQLLLQMQRDLVSTPVITQYINTSSTSATGVTMRQQPTLTPIGSTASGNHMIYTTSADGISGTQKIYIQKAPTAASTSSNQQQQIAVGSNTQVPSSLNTNAVITLSNVKLDNDGTQSTPGGANILTIDSSGAVGNSSTSSGQNVNIISTASGQQLAVHSIGSVQHGAAAQLTSGSSTPLIVTTSARNSQHMQQQQQLVHPQQQTQQIVWRQIGSTNLGSATGVLTTSSEAAAAAMAAGNKIVWASRPGQKRQLNGPDGADINKLLLNRKLSQRKIISQQPQQQHQIQITKQHFQQIQQQQQQLQQQQQALQIQDDDVNTTTIHEGQQQQHHHQQQQLQKVQMQSGKVIKMSSFPLLVSELNMSQQTQQQQQLQQKQNSAAVAANHNYSLQPTAIISPQTNQQQQQISTGGGNKIILTNTGGGGGIGASGSTNFTIATTTELQQQQGTQKIHYKDLQNSNLKVNFVSTSGGIQQGNIVVDAKTVAAAAAQQQQQQQHQQQQHQHQQQQHQQQQAVVLNKAAPHSLQQQQLLQQQQKLKRERILNIIGATSAAGVDATGAATVNVSSGTTATAENKRVLFTSVLNVKPLQKNNAGQMQMQLAPGGLAHAVLRGRFSNNQTIYTNMRSLPIATAANSQVMSAATAAITTSNNNIAVPTTITNNATPADTTMTTIVGEVKTIENVTVNNNNNNNNNGSIGALVANSSSNITNSSSNGNLTVSNSNIATTASATINR